MEEGTTMIFMFKEGINIGKRKKRKRKCQRLFGIKLSDERRHGRL